MNERAVSYPNTVEYLYGLQNELKPGARFGLERMRTLLEALGQPEANQSIVHVAGTNGKGSTCAIIASVLRESGVDVGLNTSPHLIEPTERIQLNGTPISRSEFEVAFQQVHTAAERLVARGQIDEHPSYFETVTAMALCFFQGRSQATVLEVGLGGRLDATNVVTPQLTVITPIAFDHEAFLGNTLESIASEKAGILKRGVPLVLSPQSTAAERVILSRAADLACPVVKADVQDLQDVVVTSTGSQFLLHGVCYQCPLAGRHQVQNAMTAILACETFGIETSAIQEGLRKTRWPGRLEYVQHGPDLVLDGAHNPAGAAALAEYIREFIAPRPVWLVYGTMRDKALEEVSSTLFASAERVIVTAPSLPRALRPEAILAATDHPNAAAAGSLEAALRLAQMAPPDAVVFITGSLYLVGEARAILLSRMEGLVK